MQHALDCKQVKPKGELQRWNEEKKKFRIKSVSRIKLGNLKGPHYGDFQVYINQLFLLVYF